MLKKTIVGVRVLPAPVHTADHSISAMPARAIIPFHIPGTRTSAILVRLAPPGFTTDCATATARPGRAAILIITACNLERTRSSPIESLAGRHSGIVFDARDEVYERVRILEPAAALVRVHTTKFAFP